MSRPPETRADRRARRKSAAKPARDLPSLRDRVASVSVSDAPPDAVARARRILLSWIDAASREGRGFGRIASDLATGAAARRIAGMARDMMLRAPPAEVRDAACHDGCAWCCILAGGDGGTITEVEAREVHAALVTLAGQPDGRTWWPGACPALDPETRSCRIYQSRPTICRSFLSTDADACRRAAAGNGDLDGDGDAIGAGILGSHVDYLAVLALSRAALAGAARVRTFALRDVAAAALDGADAERALADGRHADRILSEVQRGSSVALSRAGRP